jgi:A/G-specific adenine glycosylase
VEHAAVASAIVTHYTRDRRDLPWRRTRDPYAIWISEIMLQQTQVTTVIPYWERWMRELPRVQSLARAHPDRVLKLWEGLGYYTRAANLRKAAQIIIEKHAGRFPERFADVLALPGIGRYTAGAICSIAFNQPTPVLDGNVIRVLTRIFGIAENPREKITGAKLWNLAAVLVEEAAKLRHPETAGPNCSHLNQALMELGALICAPRRPQCPLCPVRKSCVAFLQNRVDQLPHLGPRIASTKRRYAAFIIERNGRYLVCKRPAGVVNARLWEFPNAEVEGRGRRSQGRQLAKDLFGSSPFDLQLLHQVHHTITRYRITMDVFRVEFADGLFGSISNGRWCSLSELRKLALPSAHRNILKLLAEAQRRREENFDDLAAKRRKRRKKRKNGQ